MLTVEANCLSAAASVCITGTGGIQGVCGVGEVQSVTQAYLIAPSEAIRFELGAAPFDPALAGAFFGFSFASTIFIWLTALGFGYVLRQVKRG